MFRVCILFFLSSLAAVIGFLLGFFFKRERALSTLQYQLARQSSTALPPLNSRLFPNFVFAHLSRVVAETLFIKLISCSTVSRGESSGSRSEKDSSLNSRVQRLKFIDIPSQKKLAALVNGELRPGVCLSAHLGNFELLASSCRTLGIPLSVVARRPNYSLLFNIVSKIRNSYGADIIWREDKKAGIKLIAAIKKQKLIAALIDQDIDLENSFAKFFGVPAAYPSALLKIAVKKRLPIVVVLSRRKSVLKHEFIIERIGYDPDGDQPIAQILDAFSKILEREIAKDPTQWVWWHKRWRREVGVDYEQEPHRLKSTRSYIAWLEQKVGAP